MSQHSPTALILPTRGGNTAVTVEALRHQTQPPHRVLQVSSSGPNSSEYRFASSGPVRVEGFADALRVASEAGAWVWLIDSGVRPERQALEALLTGLMAMPCEPSPGLLASQVLRADRTLDPASVPAAEVHRPERVLGAMERRVLALRAARYGSLLVHLDSALSSGVVGRRGRPANDLEWTVRLLHDHAGALVPKSKVVREAGERPQRPLSDVTQLAGALRLLVELEPRERLWFLMRLMSRPTRG